VIVSDGVGQFAVGGHALCWVHAERLVHKLDTFTDRHRAAPERLRALIWWFYADLKAYRRSPTARRRGELRARFDRIFRRRTVDSCLIDRTLSDFILPLMCDCFLAERRTGSWRCAGCRSSRQPAQPHAAGFDDGKMASPIVARHDQIGEAWSNLKRPWHWNAKQDDAAFCRQG
jgi:hypothetical protein